MCCRSMTLLKIALLKAINEDRGSPSLDAWRLRPSLQHGCDAYRCGSGGVTLSHQHLVGKARV